MGLKSCGGLAHAAPHFLDADTPDSRAAMGSVGGNDSALEEMNGPQGTGGVHGVTGATAGSIGQQARTWGNLVSRGSVGIFYPIFWVKVGCF